MNKFIAIVVVIAAWETNHSSWW